MQKEEEEEENSQLLPSLESARLDELRLLDPKAKGLQGLFRVFRFCSKTLL
jgi:hypothetical protein